MPWRIEERSEIDGERQYCVVKETDGSTEACHSSRADAEAQMAALYASEDETKGARLAAFLNNRIRQMLDAGEDEAEIVGEMAQQASIDASTVRQILNGDIERPPDGRLDAFAEVLQVDAARLKELADADARTGKHLPDVKAVKMLGQNRVGGYAVIWGDSSERDLDGEWFDSKTEELTSIYKAMGRLPYLYNHATDDTIKSSVVGSVDVMEPDDIGLWYEAQLDLANQYKDAIRHLVSEKALGTSSGTLPGARRVEKNGRIARWPVVELSATPTPADPRQMQRPVAEVKSAFKSIGLDFTTNGETDTPEAGGTPAATVPDEVERANLELDLLELEIA